MTSVHKRNDNRIFEKQCKSLVEAGFSVTLIVNDGLLDEYIDGVNIISTRRTYKNRVVKLMCSQKELFKKAIEIDADIYHLHDPDLLFLGNKLIRLGKKVIFDSHESVPDQIKEKEWIPKYLRNFISFMYYNLEKTSLKNYQGVISVSPQIVERLKLINPNTVMITNYPKITNCKSTRKPQKSICFAGTINSEWNHIEILDAIQDIEDITYYLAGPADEIYLEKLKKHNSWHKVKYFGVLSYEKVKEIYSISNIGMAINSSKQIKGIGTLGNTKIFEYMEVELPMICSNYLLWEGILSEYKCGISVNPKNINDIRYSILHIMNNQEEALEMGKNGRRAIEEKYNWESQKKILIEFYNVIKGGSNEL